MPCGISSTKHCGADQPEPRWRLFCVSRTKHGLRRIPGVVQPRTTACTSFAARPAPRTIGRHGPRWSPWPRANRKAGSAVVGTASPSPVGAYNSTLYKISPAEKLGQHTHTMAGKPYHIHATINQQIKTVPWHCYTVAMVGGDSMRAAPDDAPWPQPRPFSATPDKGKIYSARLEPSHLRISSTGIPLRAA